MIRRSGLLEFWTPESLKDVGGLNQLKKFIANRAKAFETGNENLPRPRGVILVGIPGTGKSLTSKATANILGWPLIRLDIGALKGSLVGESEQKMRSALKVIDAFGESVIWIDEVEKAFAGTRSSGDTDAGTTANMFGAFLTWMQETQTSVMVMATANDISKLPPELVRAGRFDATFFIDCPSTPERVEIIKIMNRKYNTKIPISYANRNLPVGLALRSNNWPKTVCMTVLMQRLKRSCRSVEPCEKRCKSSKIGRRTVQDGPTPLRINPKDNVN